MAAKDQGLGGDERPADASALGDAVRIRAILIDAARAARSVSYSELLGDLGFRFTRPKMRAVCRTLEEVDRLSALEGEPDLAVLVVRESDRLPGQGWWVGGTALLLDYDGPWEGAAAARFIREQQQAVFDYWAER
ncbi:ribose-phosphate pyrophosphokinase [Sphingopyxis chilensis]